MKINSPEIISKVRTLNPLLRIYYTLLSVAYPFTIFYAIAALPTTGLLEKIPKFWPIYVMYVLPLPFFVAMFKKNILRYDEGSKFKTRAVIGGIMSLGIPLGLLWGIIYIVFILLK